MVSCSTHHHVDVHGLGWVHRRALVEVIVRHQPVKVDQGSPRRHGGLQVAQDLDTALIRPVMQDAFHDVDVSPDWYLLEEIALHVWQPGHSALN
jgi:hypothetical protein